MQKWVERAAHVGGLQELLDGFDFAAGDGRLALGLQQAAVVGDVLLQELVGVGVEVHDVALVALGHHARVRRADAPRTDDPNRLVLRAHKFVTWGDTIGISSQPMTSAPGTRCQL